MIFFRRVTSFKVIYKNFLRAKKINIRKVYVSTFLEVTPSLNGRIQMLEKQIENKLTLAVKNAGGIAPKFTSPGFAGMPDRLILLPDGHMAFAELKAPGKRPRPLQEARHRLLRKLGYRVYVIDDVNEIGGILDEIRAT